MSDRKFSCAQVEREVIVTNVLRPPVTEKFTTDWPETLVENVDSSNRKH